MEDRSALRLAAATGIILFALMYTLILIYSSDRSTIKIVGYALLSFFMGGVLGGAIVGGLLGTIYENCIEPYCISVSNKPQLPESTTELV